MKFHHILLHKYFQYTNVAGYIKTQLADEIFSKYTNFTG